jgi:alkylated DNA repair dioxygenase AlkB
MILNYYYESNFVSTVEEKELLKRINQEDWCLDLKRRTQHFGYKYDYTKKRVDKSMKVADPPKYLEPIIDRLAHYFPHRPDQVIVNEYQPGQQIAPHIDCMPCFGPVVASLTLGAGNRMEFTSTDVVVSSPVRVPLETRSLIILSGDSRYNWKHSLPPQPEGTRVSLTFRTVELTG